MKKFIINIIIIFILLFPNFVFANNTQYDSKIENGTYEIYTCVGDTKVIDIQAASKNNCANVQIYERNNVPQQKFKAVLNNDGTYTLMAIHSNKVLDVQYAGKANGTNVWQYDKNNSDAQKWILKSCGNGYYNIISKLNGLYLDISGGIQKDGQNIQVYEGNGTNAQKFKFSKVEDLKGNKELENGIYNIYSKVADNRLLEVPNAKVNNEAIIKTGTNNNRANQKFKLTYNNDGTYTIMALHSGRVLDVKCAGGKNGTIVQQYDYNGTNAQKWIILKNDDKTYSIISKCNGLALDIAYGSKAIGTNLQTYKLNNSSAQKFTFEVCKPEQGTKSAENGTYRILSCANDRKVFDIEYGSVQSGAKAQLWENDNVIQQKYNIEYIDNGYYKIKSKKSNKALTVESSNPRIGSKITQQDDKNLDTQKWILKKQSESVYSIISKCGNMYIDIGDLNTKNGQTLQLKYENDLAGQKFILVNETPKDNIEQIQDGIYQIVSKSNKVIDISCASYDDFANVQIWNNAKVAQQKFYISKVNNSNYYKIVAVHSNKALDVQNGNSNLLANVGQYAQNGTDNQYWYFKNCGDGYYNIVSKANGLVLDVANGCINNNGSNIGLYFNNGTNAQKFKLQPINIIENNTYEIETKIDSNKVIDISAGASNDGANTQIWNADNVNQQRFKFEAINSDTYKILAKHSNKALTVDTKNNNVYQSTYTGETNQQWQIKTAGQGYYNLVSKANGLALDVKNGTPNNGQNVWTYKSNGSNAQKFRFVTGFRKFYEEGTYGRSGLAIKGDWRGSNLKYYKIGKGPKSLFLTFSIHGFEDSYNNDGAELTYIAEEFKNYLYNNADESIINNWKIYIFPDLNPDGQKYGWTNNGPGRTTLYSAAPGNKGIDMNRNWSVGYNSEKSDRNYNGTEPFQSYEARALRDFLLNHQGDKNILVDTHGWLNETIGDYRLGGYYRNQFGLPTHIGTYGRGYLVNWARTLRNASSTLVELPQVWNHNQTVNWNYAQKFRNATMQLLREN